MEYRGLTFTPLGTETLTDEQMDRFEADYGIHIPAELKELFRRSNDSFLRYPIIECEGMPGGVMPERWTGISKHGMTYLLELYGHTLGSNMLPFATDPGGHVFSVKMDGDKQIGVYYIDMSEMKDSADQNVYKSYKIADNLPQFLSLIQNSR